MANPRKFSEKIALHTHRQAEETARFEQIMKEVSDATAQVHSEKCTRASLRINNQVLGAFKGGSLPNVSAQNIKATPQIKECKKVDEVSHSHTNVRYRESRARSQGGPIRRPQDRRHDTSPYSSGPFLSPPPDTSWRRTNSDSALHQSAMQGMTNERNDNQTNRWVVPTINCPEQQDNRRPRSSCEVPRVPGINIYHTTHDPGIVQIPIGNNTGSLPDLTSVHFPSPIHTPIDQDHDQGSSPYSSSPVNTSPSTLSPTSVPPNVSQQGQFHFNNSVSVNQNHLSVPVNSRYLHHNKNITLDKTTPPDNNDYTQLGSLGEFYQVASSSPSPTQVGYRSPRPSPQSSPSLGGRHSAPCSPGVPSPLSPLTNDYVYNQHQAVQLQQHFEQFSMVDPPVSGVSFIDQPGNIHLSTSQGQTVTDVVDIPGDAGYYSTSPSQLVYHTAPASLHTTPNTPNSIPDITLTDFSSNEDITRQDLALTKQLEAELLAHESLREGLEPLDFDGYQMLTDPGLNLIADGVEDHFRLDRS